MIEESGYGSVPLTNGSGSGSRRPKNIWIRRIRIRNTGSLFWRIFVKSYRKNSTRTSCTVCTGVVLQWLQSSPLLENISHLIVDEIHERDINSDFLITIIKDILPLRPDLKVSSSFSQI
jgi:hypothetical protein